MVMVMVTVTVLTGQWRNEIPTGDTEVLRGVGQRLERVADV